MTDGDVDITAVDDTLIESATVTIANVQDGAAKTRGFFAACTGILIDGAGTATANLNGPAR
ncbi:MAG: hypothetical protein GY708_30800 [Actinomycetia bacterium]|nr:hypothetical protein [Actinomycetes bacterium]